MRRLPSFSSRVLLPGAISVALFAGLFGPATALADTAAEHEAPAEGAHAEGTAEGGDHAAKPPALVELKPITLPLLGATGPRQAIALMVTIQPTTEDASKALTAEKPVIVDAIFTELYGTLDAGSLMKGDIVDASLLKPRLKEIVAKVAPAEDVEDILIQDLMQRRLR